MHAGRTCKIIKNQKLNMFTTTTELGQQALNGSLLKPLDRWAWE